MQLFRLYRERFKVDRQTGNFSWMAVFVIFLTEGRNFWKGFPKRNPFPFPPSANNIRLQDQNREIVRRYELQWDKFWGGGRAIQGVSRFLPPPPRNRSPHTGRVQCTTGTICKLMRPGGGGLLRRHDTCWEACDSQLDRNATVMRAVIMHRRPVPLIALNSFLCRSPPDHSPLLLHTNIPYHAPGTVSEYAFGVFPTFRTLFLDVRFEIARSLTSVD